MADMELPAYEQTLSQTRRFCMSCALVGGGVREREGILLLSGVVGLERRADWMSSGCLAYVVRRCNADKDADKPMASFHHHHSSGHLSFFYIIIIIITFCPVSNCRSN
jgi:hypothetical protein